MNDGISRRKILRDAAGVAALSMLRGTGVASVSRSGPEGPLEEFGYDQVQVRGVVQTAQRDNVLSVLMGLGDDSLMKPFREMAGLEGPGASLGGWYEWKPDYDFRHGDAGLAPAATFGQWTSALARFHAGSRFGGGQGQGELAARVTRLHAQLSSAIAPGYFAKTRFAGYSFDKLVCGLMDAHRLLHDPSAFATLDKVTAAAEPVLPGRPIDRDIQWKIGADTSWLWDENYTMPENLYLVAAMGAGSRYRRMAETYLDDETFFGPLARGVNALSDRHAYSYVNALCSAMQAYLCAGSAMHLNAAKNGFAMLQQQSFATGGWGPDETLRKPGYDQVNKSLANSHNGFETPCGSYAHMKLTRYLLRVTRDGRYGDSMERVMYNTVFGALPLEPDGRSFYSSDYNFVARRIYSVHRWPCCSGTLPQVVADYGINSYFRSPGAVWVNLYQPSELRWVEGTRPLAIEQTGDYPYESAVRLRITTSAPTPFRLHLRIPDWARTGATLKLNGRATPIIRAKGFASVERLWRSGDMVELNLPLDHRLEALPANGGPGHPDTVALMRGPLVLFALRDVNEVGPVVMRQSDLVAAERTGARVWSVKSSTGTRRMVPFTEVGDQVYSTYVKLSS